MAEYFLTFTDPSLRGTWATYTYVDTLKTNIDSSLVSLKQYTDSSLAKRDVSLNILFDYVGTGVVASKTYTDGSLNARDVSIAWLKNNYVSKTYTDVSLYIRDASIIWLKTNINTINASINYVKAAYIKDTCIGSEIFWNGGVLDVSIDIRNSLNSLIDTSILNLTDTQALQYDSSIAKWKNVNTVDIADYFYDKAYIDSLGLPGDEYIKNSSLGSGLYWNNGYVDVSAAYIPINASHNSISITSYTVSVSDNNNLICIDASETTVIFPNTLPLGFQTTVVNDTTGTVTLNASTLLTTDSSIVLRDRYAAASIYHKGSGVFYAFGNLK
jgi:hypothetical protein